MKRRPAKLNRSGMTLIELIVGLFVLVIFTSCLVAVVAPTMENYARTVEQADISVLAVNITDEVYNELLFAKSPSISPDGARIDFERTDGKHVTLETIDGVLHKNGQAVFDEKYYDGSTLEIHYGNGGGSSIQVTISVEGRRELSNITKVIVINPLSA